MWRPTGVKLQARLESAKSAPVAAGGGDRPRFAFIPNNQSSFWEEARAGCLKAEAELGIAVDFQMPALQEAAEQNRIIESLLQKGGMKGMAISVISPESQGGLLAKVAEKMPLVTHDSDAPASARKVYLGTNNYEAGRALGKLIKGKAAGRRQADDLCRQRGRAECGGPPARFVESGHPMRVGKTGHGCLGSEESPQSEAREIMPAITAPEAARPSAFQAVSRRAGSGGSQRSVSCAGEVVAVMGENGAGKSTLMKALAGSASTRCGGDPLAREKLSGSPAWHRRRRWALRSSIRN